MMVAVSGVNFGFQRTQMHIAGICIGFAVMVFLVGVGMGGIFNDNPLLHTVLRYVAFAFLIWLAWRIATSDLADGDGNAKARPLSFLQAAMFQWVNPKAWAMAIGAMTTFMSVGGALYLQALLITSVFFLISIPCVSFWAWFGAGAGRFLKHNRLRLRVFNVTMAALLVGSMLPTLF